MLNFVQSLLFLFEVLNLRRLTAVYRHLRRRSRVQYIGNTAHMFTVMLGVPGSRPAGADTMGRGAGEFMGSIA